MKKRDVLNLMRANLRHKWYILKATQHPLRTKKELQSGGTDRSSEDSLKKPTCSSKHTFRLSRFVSSRTRDEP